MQKPARYIALPLDTVNELKIEVGSLLRKYEDDLRVITAEDPRKQLGV